MPADSCHIDVSPDSSPAARPAKGAHPPAHGPHLLSSKGLCLPSSDRSLSGLCPDSDTDTRVYLSWNRNSLPCRHSPLESPACSLPATPTSTEVCLTGARSASLPLCLAPSHQQDPSLPGSAPQTLLELASLKSRHSLLGSLLRLPSASRLLPLVPLAHPQPPSGPSLPSQPWRETWLPTAESGVDAAASQAFLTPLVSFADLLPPPAPDLGSPQKSLLGTSSSSFSVVGLPACLASGLAAHPPEAQGLPPCLKLTCPTQGSEATSYPHLPTCALISTVIRGQDACDLPPQAHWPCTVPCHTPPHLTPITGSPSSEPPTGASTPLTSFMPPQHFPVSP